MRACDKWFEVLGSGGLGDVDLLCDRAPVPWQQGFELIRLGLAADNALQHIAQIEEGVVTVEPGALDQGDEDRPGSGTALGPGEQ